MNPQLKGVVDSHEEDGSDSDYVYGDSGSEGEGQNTCCLDDSSDDDDEPKVAKPVTEVIDSSDDQKSLADLDEDHKKLDEFIEFVEERNMKNPKLVCGMLFPNVRVFRALLKEYHIKEGYQYKYLKNERSRVTVQCIHNEKDMEGLGSPCTFRLHASKTHDNGSFQIKRIRGKHSCLRTYENKWATSTWLAHKYADKVHDTPEWRVK